MLFVQRGLLIWCHGRDCEPSFLYVKHVYSLYKTQMTNCLGWAWKSITVYWFKSPPQPKKRKKRKHNKTVEFDALFLSLATYYQIISFTHYWCFSWLVFLKYKKWAWINQSVCVIRRLDMHDWWIKLTKIVEAGWPFCRYNDIRN